MCALWPRWVYCMLANGRVCWNPVSSSKLFSSNLDPNTLTKRKVSQHCQLPSLISPRLFIYVPLFPSLTPSFGDSDLCACPHWNLWVPAVPLAFPVAPRPPPPSGPSLLSWLRARSVPAAFHAWSYIRALVSILSRLCVFVLDCTFPLDRPLYRTPGGTVSCT